MYVIFCFAQYKPKNGTPENVYEHVYTFVCVCVYVLLIVCVCVCVCFEIKSNS